MAMASFLVWFIFRVVSVSVSVCMFVCVGVIVECWNIDAYAIKEGLVGTQGQSWTLTDVFFAGIPSFPILKD